MEHDVVICLSTGEPDTEDGPDMAMTLGLMPTETLHEYVNRRLRQRAAIGKLLGPSVQLQLNFSYKGEWRDG